jgi:hypothetical protein
MDAPDDYDSPWKEAVEVMLPEFMALYFPDTPIQIGLVGWVERMRNPPGPCPVFTPAKSSKSPGLGGRQFRWFCASSVRHGHGGFRIRSTHPAR